MPGFWPLGVALAALFLFFAAVSEAGYWTGVAGRRLLRAWRERTDNRPIGEGFVLFALVALVLLGTAVLVNLLALPPWGFGPEEEAQVTGEAAPVSVGTWAIIFARELPVRRVVGGALVVAAGMILVVAAVRTLLRRRAERGGPAVR
ncbi:MAG TPA: hypothetical protein GXX55_10430 [Firmicutes bacterium]|nr:hypothetical protein [Bacillota bacterium]